MQCAICANTQQNRRYTAREMMYGLRDTFTYGECAQCGCLQLLDAPTDWERYYPAGYYSFRARPAHRAARLIRRLRDGAVLRGKGLIGRLLLALHPGDRNVLQALQALTRLQPASVCRILDVGCGAGLLLDSLHSLGFRNLCGLDPYLPADTQSASGVPLRKQPVHHLAAVGAWDMLMFHHSFEHLANPVETLAAVARLLVPGGVCLLRMPVVPSYAWQTYRTDWVQLDAPRHCFVYSVEGVGLLARRAALHLDAVSYDATAFQFWASEQYQRDIPLFSARSYASNPARSIFSPADIQAFQRKAASLNRAGQGDSAVYYLRKPAAASATEREQP